MLQVDFGKVLVSFTCLITGIVLILTGSTEQGLSLTFAVLGYTMGNGRLVLSGKDPVPMFQRSDRERDRIARQTDGKEL